MSATDIVINGLEARIRELEAAYAAKMNETRYVAAERDALRKALHEIAASSTTGNVQCIASAALARGEPTP